jgi:hypothetical protein
MPAPAAASTSVTVSVTASTRTRNAAASDRPAREISGRAQSATLTNANGSSNAQPARCRSFLVRWPEVS